LDGPKPIKQTEVVCTYVHYTAAEARAGLTVTGTTDIVLSPEGDQAARVVTTNVFVSTGGSTTDLDGCRFFILPAPVPPSNALPTRATQRFSSTGAEHQEDEKLKLARLEKLMTQQRLEMTFSSRDSWFEILLIHGDLR
jgi:hypothetical protein